jgi:methylase of polypeptide subunit release factors
MRKRSSRRRGAGKRELKSERMARKAAAAASQQSTNPSEQETGPERAAQPECLEGSVRFSAGEGVFFSRSQEANRSLSVRVLIEFGRIYGPLSVLEAMCGSGVRACRYAIEVGPVTHVTANDVQSQAYECARANVRTNGIGGKVQVVAVSPARSASGAPHSALPRAELCALDSTGGRGACIRSAVAMPQS